MTDLASTTYSNLSLSPMRILPPNATISKTLEKFQQSLDPIGIVSHTDPNKIIGIISLHDIFKFTMKELIKGKPVKQDPVEWALTLNPEDESYLVWERHLGDLMRDALEAFTAGLHYGLVSDLDKHFILTQYALLNYLLEHGDGLDKDVREWINWKPFDGSKVISVNGDDTLEQGFKVIHTARVPSVPVIQAGKYISTLDYLSVFGINSHDQLQQPITEIVKFRKIVDYCNAGSSCRQVIEIMLNSHISRVWILDNAKVLGVVSQSDIIGCLIGSIPKAPK
ncbi:hypothetical protein HDV01_005171 [Terramyces sp. JEL0728]|nr:hypothetical protein HDV01_005171 [Terramyces sp. JEL0728]